MKQRVIFFTEIGLVLGVVLCLAMLLRTAYVKRMRSKNRKYN